MTAADSLCDDRALLREYTERASEPAFAGLVRRHVDHVYAAALRRVNGDRALAEDVTQTVFTDFARKACALPADMPPGGWLHRHTGFVASKAIAHERRRRDREHKAAAMNVLTDSARDESWAATAPLLDAALDSLPPPDRDAIVLRFFEKHDYRAVGRALGISDDTAQKRVTRALDKLRVLLSRHRVTGSGATLSAMLLANAVLPAPAAFATGLPGRALAGAATGSTGTLAAAFASLTGAARWKVATGAALLALTAAAIPIVVQRSRPQASPPHEQAVGPPPANPQPPGPLTAAASPSPATPAPASLAERIAEAAAAVRGGAQNVSATGRALAILTAIPVKDAKEALGLIKVVPDEPARGLLYKYFLSHWAETSPWEALDYANAEIADPYKASVCEGVLCAWAARDPESLLGWHQKTRAGSAPPMSDSLIATVFKTLASRDPADAFKYLERLPSANARAQALRGLIDTIQTDAGRTRLLEVIAQHRDSELRLHARRAVVENWTRQDAAAAAAWVEKTEPAWERTRLMDSLGFVWLQADPAAAATWWMQRAPGPDTMVKIINVWAQEDPKAAAEWLRTQPAGPQSDTARMTFSRQVADLDSESALQWAATVSDEPMRENTIDHIFKNWTARDAAAAAGFLKSSGWPAERVSRLQTP